MGTGQLASHHLIPLSQSGEATTDPDGTIYFVRPPFHRQAVKRYHGGTARKIWRFAPKDAEATNLTADYVGESFAPMWEHGRVYFVTDRDGTLNIWSMKDTGGDLKQHTKHSGWDVQSPDLHQGRIVYQLGADLWLYDIATGVDRVIPITLASDFDQLREKWVERPIEHLSSAHLHPTGQSVVLTARGGVFVAPAKGGRFVRVARKPGIRYRDACFMPNGRQLLALSDESGELEFHLLPARGLSSGKAITHDGKILKWRGYPAPDGKHFAYADKNDDLWVTDVANGESKKISRTREGIHAVVWSPDSRCLGVWRNGPQYVSAVAPLRIGDGHDDDAHERSLQQFQPGLEPRRRVALFPLRSSYALDRSRTVGNAATRTLFRQADGDLPTRPAKGDSFAVSADRRVACHGANRRPPTPQDCSRRGQGSGRGR